MAKVIKAITVLLVFTLIGVEVNAQTDPQVKVVVIPMSGNSEECKEPSKYVGFITDAANPLSSGPGIPGLWSYSGQTGIIAGDQMCNAIGADHPCTYADLLTAEGNGELEGVKAMEDLTFWVHRVQTTVDVVVSSLPGAGGRCNDWKEASNQLSDGEYAQVSGGAINYFFDIDTAYTGDPAHGHQGSGPNDGGPCHVPRALLCCN